MVRIVRRLIIGKPLHNREMVHERLPKWKALSIFSSDALSSVAYGPEQIALTLVAVPGLLAYGYMAPIAIAIFLLLAIVAVSYVQVAKANPGGGGAYAIAKKNLGEYPALVAAGSVFADYILTAAVSVAAGTSALISAFPNLAGHEVGIDLFVLLLFLMLINLRGVRESSNAFVFPTYAFLFGVLVLIGTGVYKAVMLDPVLIPVESWQTEPVSWGMLYLILRAFANGCSSMTGIEAISDSVPMFQAPEARNATITTYWMAGILGVMFLGITFLIMHYHIMPLPEVTAMAQMAKQIFGENIIYYYIQITTMLVLYLAANTAYNGLPILLSIIARDGYLPRYLAARGERLTYSNGIVLLTIIAALLIVIYEGKIESLISLYAIGVFISFTIAQSSMVKHWWQEKGPGWRVSAVVNGVGAVATGIVVTVITMTKFIHGAWVVLLFIPIMVYVFKQIRGHYDAVARQLHLPLDEYEDSHAKLEVRPKHLVIVPVASPTRAVYETLKYAKLISDQVVAVHVSDNEETEIKVKEKWQLWDPGVDLVVLRSPYRVLMKPFVHFIQKKEREKGEQDYITVVIPEFETKKWWHRLLHNQTGLILRTSLIFSKNIVVTTVPYHLKE